MVDRRPDRRLPIRSDISRAEARNLAAPIASSGRSRHGAEAPVRRTARRLRRQPPRWLGPSSRRSPYESDRTRSGHPLSSRPAGDRGDARHGSAHVSAGGHPRRIAVARIRRPRLAGGAGGCFAARRGGSRYRCIVSGEWRVRRGATQSPARRPPDEARADGIDPERHRVGSHPASDVRRRQVGRVCCPSGSRAEDAKAVGRRLELGLRLVLGHEVVFD